jgi:predicted nucleotidyltransferase
MLSLDEVLRRLHENSDRLSALGVLKLGVFGSIVRGEQHAGSDLDFLVELDRRTFDRYMDLKLFLEDLFGSRVDLVLADRIRPELRDRILGELVDAA